VNETHLKLNVPTHQASLAAAWLRDLSDSYTYFDIDITRRIPGPVTVGEAGISAKIKTNNDPVCPSKPYFIGMKPGSGTPLPEFSWKEPGEQPLRRTPLFDKHIKSGAKMVPFAGWEMPVWYTSVLEEHLATRQGAGLFDVSHMGVYQAEGPQAAAYLDSVCANDISVLNIGDSCYTHFLDPNANVIDDTLVYRRDSFKYLVVVNASNDDKDWAWLSGVREGKVLIDKSRPWVKSYGRGVILRNLRDPGAGQDMKLDIAIQGRRSREILLDLGCDPELKDKVLKLERTRLCEGKIGGYDLIISRTGYTGEKMAFELFVHPDDVVNLWNALVSAGAAKGLKPCGLGARDSLRTEAGLPLYGHEMAGDLGLGVAEAGFGSYVKIHKPWFIGREAYIAREAARTGVVARFRFTEKAVRMAHCGDPVVDSKGRVIGTVTSCAIDSEGYLTGQAYLDKSAAVEGTSISIFQSASKQGNPSPADLKPGDKITLPGQAVVLSRFPKIS
jgi:glycine hydroxymethyltransferase